MTHRFCLPTAENFSFSDRFAANLRPRNGVLTPCGCPRTLLTHAGAENFRLDSGSILSVGDDRHTLYIDGNEIGSLGAAFGALLPGGLVLTANGDAEWLMGGKLCGTFKDNIDFSFSASASEDMSVSVDEIKFSDSYPRSSGTLTAKDCATAATALRKAMRQMEESAALSGKRVQPVWVAWQIKDADSKVIARSQPQLVGDFQCLQGFTMPVRHDGDKLTAMGAGVLVGRPYTLHMSMERCVDDWKRAKAVMLEIFVSPQLGYMTDARGAFSEVDSVHSVLMVSPLGADDASLERVKSAALASFGSQGSLCLQVRYPLEGFDVEIPVGAMDMERSWGRQLAEPKVVEALCAGSATFMADAENTGVLLTALSSTPLSPIGSQKVSAGKILRIVTPAGGGGGWNYGRYHLLVFAADGIYAVSADRSLTVISSTLLHSCGIDRPDAVAVSPDAIYCATMSGRLLRIKGSSITPLEVPFTPIALCSCGHELWILTSTGRTLTVNSAGGICLRTDVNAQSFSTDLHPMAVDSSGALRDLACELPLPTRVEYSAPLPEPLPRHSMMSWHIASTLVRDLTLSVLASSGADPIPVVTLTLQGSINSPVTARLLSPAHPYSALSLSGTLSPASPLRKFDIFYPANTCF